MKKVKYLILGAGPAGLTLANKLLEAGENSFLILEKEKEAGGLCRSVMIDGSPLDIGGGHFLDARNKKVLDFIFQFMPKVEWKKFQRKSTIKVGETEIDYPFEANIWQFPVREQAEFLLSIFKAGCNLGKEKPESFRDWIRWKLGDKIAEDYMLPYNEKIWSVDLNKLGTYWLHKLPDVSVKESLISCLEKKPSGKIPAHATFYYPKKFGYGEVWKRMAANLGGRIKYSTAVNMIDADSKTVNNRYSAQFIVNSIPWPEIDFLGSVPDGVVSSIQKLEHTPIRTTYYSENLKTKAHWTYTPDKSLSEHRYLFRFNFIAGAKGYWTEANENRALKNDSGNQPYWNNKYAYPLNTIDKPRSINFILEHFASKSIYGLGRWGEWEHMNSDATVARSLEFIERIL